MRRLRRARLLRSQRHARLRRDRRPTSRWAAPSTSCTPATWPTSATTAWSRSSVAAAGSPRWSACGSTSTRSSATSADTGRTASLHRPRRRRGRPGAAPRPAAPAVTELVTRQHGIPAAAVVVLDGLEAPRLATGKPDYPGMAELLGQPHRSRRRSAGRRPPGRTGATASSTSTGRCWSPRRDSADELHRPRWRLAVLRRGVAAARAGPRRTARRLAPAGTASTSSRPARRTARRRRGAARSGCTASRPAS